MPLPPKQAVMSAALGIALAAAPTVPARAESPPPADAAELKRVADDLKRVRDDVKDLQDFQKDARAAVYGTKDTPGGLNNGVLGKLNLLDDKVQSLEKKLDRLNDRLDVMTRTAASSPLGSGGPATGGVPQTMAPPPGVTSLASRGTVRLVNEYATDVSLLLNGKAYRLGAGETRSIDTPPGSYTYELLQSGAQPVTSTIKDGETVTLRIH